MNIIIDIGNTAVKVCRAEGMTLGKTYRYQGEKVMNFIFSLLDKERPEVMVICSSYEISQSDRRRLASVCNRLLILDSSTGEILRSKGFPEYLSYDRAAALLAASYLFKGKACTVVDFGTTLTVDFISGEGEYLGGNISLGCRTRFKALNRYSKSLPLISAPDDVPVLGSSLESSLSSGAVSGIMFEIGGYIGLHPSNIVVFTGGDAIYFAKKMKNSIFVVSNLVLMGLALIAREYVGSM